MDNFVKGGIIDEKPQIVAVFVRCDDFVWMPSFPYEL